jgi:hypothetical protein
LPGFAQVQLLDANEIALAPPVLLAGTYNPGELAPGNYFIEISFSDGTYSLLPFVVQNADPITIIAINASAEIVALPNASIDFEADLSENASVFWDFGDGNQTVGNPANHTYSFAGTFQVQCIATNSTCSDTNFISIEVGDPVKTNFNSESEIFLFPNPASEYLKLSGYFPEGTSGVIMDVTGKCVLNFLFQDAINVSTLPNGLYSVRILLNSGEIDKRFVIMR